MTVNTKEMAGTPVETRSGLSVGKVGSFDLEAETGRLSVMRVQVPRMLAGLISDELLVAWDAIIELNNDKVVIADTAVPAQARHLAQAQPAPEVTFKEG